MGYHRAGFDVDGVDLADRPRYPFPAHRGDALEHLTHLIETGEIEQYALVHASPPCQNKCGLTVGTNRSRGWGGEHVDLVGPTRDLLDRTCLPYVIEQPNGQAVVEQNGCGYGQRAAHRPEVGADHVPGVRRTLAQSADLGPDVSGIGELSDPVARTAVPRPAASRLFQARAHPRVAGLPATSYRRVIFSSVSAILNAAVDDEYMRKNPCSASTVRAPARNAQKVAPWASERVFAAQAALPEQYRAMVDLGAGCGPRQGEAFGLAEEAIRFGTGWVHVGCRVKVVEGELVSLCPSARRSGTCPSPRRWLKH